MEEEKKVIREKKIVNKTSLSDDKVNEASKLRLDVEKMDIETEGKFSIEVINIPNEDASSTHLEIHGNTELIMAAIINTVENDEHFRTFMFRLVDAVMISRISSVTGMSKEEIIKQADEAADRANEEGIIVPMAKGGDA